MKMNKYLMLALALLTLLSGMSFGCRPGANEVNFEQLFTSPERYNGRAISIEGYYYHGFETIVLCEKLEYSGYAPGHLVPKGSPVWVEGEFTSVT